MTGEGKAHASPTKDFFVFMITKDITLQDCILDLLDNCIDGAMRLKRVTMVRPSLEKVYEGCHADISISDQRVEIVDNCGGILLDDAIDYAFHFGRRRDTPESEAASIGVYGIGMKRAIFKIGKYATVRSTTSSDRPFRVTVDVDAWLEKGDDDWDFDLEEDAPLDRSGTAVRVERLLADVAEEFTDGTFINNLRQVIARDYSLFIQKGLVVSVNGVAVKPYPFGLRTSSEFQPVKITYHDSTNVRVTIVAGMAKHPPDDSSPESPCPFDRRYYGWYVVCNDRVVLAGDKTDNTVWDNEKFPAWHLQYYGFLGIVMLYSDDPSRLPWTTTKRGVAKNSPMYRRAIVKMKQFTRLWVDYTNRRKDNQEQAKKAEGNAKFTPIADIGDSDTIMLPRFAETPRVEMTSITYRRPTREVKQVAKALGDPNISNKRIGECTFEYYMQREVPED